MDLLYGNRVENASNVSLGLLSVEGFFVDGSHRFICIVNPINLAKPTWAGSGS